MATTATSTDPQPITQPDPLAELADFFSSTAAGRANGRVTQAVLQNQQDQLKNQQYTQGSTNALNQAQFDLNAPNVRANQSVRGDILANGQDASVSGLPSYIHVPTITGGLRPSIFSDNTRQLGAGMSRNALLAQMNGGDTINYPGAPALAPIPAASALDTTLNAAAGATGLASALKNATSNGNPLGNFFNSNKNIFGGDSTITGNADPGTLAAAGYNPEDPLNADPNGIYQTGGTTVDPNAEYQAWLAQQQQSAGDTGNSSDTWDDGGFG